MSAPRRTALGLFAFAPLAITWFPAAAENAACFDPASLPLSQKSRRRAVDYMDQSNDPARHCGLCAFFAGTAAGCGTCQLLGGGPVSAGGLCSSFAARAGK